MKNKTVSVSFDWADHIGADTEYAALIATDAVIDFFMPQDWSLTQYTRTH